MNSLFIKGPRQERAVHLLLQRDGIPIKDIGLLVGALNPRQVISELRGQGFYGIILTRRYTVIDRDGKTCKPGEYYIPDSKKRIVAEALKQKDNLMGLDVVGFVDYTQSKESN